MEIPKQVKKAARELIQMYGDSFLYLGQYEGADVYQYQFAETAVVGFPILFLWKNGSVREVMGFDSVSIISQLVTED